jgi:hypothetical protein
MHDAALRRSVITNEILALLQGIELETAMCTLPLPTQAGLQLDGTSLERRVKQKRIKRYLIFNNFFYTKIILSYHTFIRDTLLHI